MAGNGLEGLLDGPAEQAWFAQPSGLTEDAEGNIWVADSETSALRVLKFADDGAVTWTRPSARACSTSASATARPTRPACSTRWVSRCCPTARWPSPTPTTAPSAATTPPRSTVSTLARGLAEPSDVLLDESGEVPLLIVVEANKHQLVRLPLPKNALQVDEGAVQTQRPKTPVAPGELALTINFSAPTGQKLDDRWGDPTQLKVSSTPPELLISGGGTSIGPVTDAGLSTPTYPRASCTSRPVPRPATVPKTPTARSLTMLPATCTSRTGASPCC